MNTSKIEQFIKGWSKIPELNFIKVLAKKFPEAEFFLVGGMVRDLLLGKDSKDFDFVVRNIPLKKLELALRRLGKVNLVGKTFGVLKFIPRNSRLLNEIDIALPRTENAFRTGRYKDVTVKSHHATSIQDDLARRDFTINAIALRLEIGDKRLETKLVDPFDGIKDLSAKKIRAVGKPLERFQEDYSRLLRGLRLSIQLGFSLETKTWQALIKKISRLNQKEDEEYLVPREVIARELNKMITHQPVAAIQLLDKSGALTLLMPELLKMKKCPQPRQFHSEGDVWKHTLMVLQALDSNSFHKEFKTKNSRPKTTNYHQISPELIWSVVFHDVGKPYTLTRTDRIHFHGHDVKSMKIFEATAERLKLASTGLNIEKIKQLIGKHMILAYVRHNQMRETTLEKYFFNDRFPGNELMMHSFADISASLPPSGKPNFDTYRKLQKRIQSLKKKFGKRQALIEVVVDGNDIMKTTKLPPSPQIGKIKEEIRELQLTGKIKNRAQAITWLKKKYTRHKL